MAPRRRNLLTGKTATVSVARGGLSIEVSDIPATDAGLAASAILNTFRNLVTAGYDELREFGPTIHSDAMAVPDEADDSEYKIAPESSGPSKKIGF